MKRTQRLVAELHALLAEPDEREVSERIIIAELQAAAAVRRVVGQDARPLVPADMIARFKRLQSTTKESGSAWRARVERLLAAALAGRTPADRAAVALVRMLLLSGNKAGCVWSGAYYSPNSAN